MYKVEAMHLNSKKLLNPIPIGLFRGLESIGGGGGGGGGWFGDQISATNGPIDSKIGTVVKQVK